MSPTCHSMPALAPSNARRLGGIVPAKPCLAPRLLLETVFLFLFLSSPLPAATVNFIQNAVDDSTSTSLDAVSSDQWLETAVTYATVTAPATTGSPALRFTHWTISDPAAALRDAWGRSNNPVSFVLLENTTATAHYLPADRDTDIDGVPDWFEIEYYGNLSNGADSDTDGDGLTLAQEYAAVTNPLFANITQAGGVAYADSGMVTCNIAGYASYTLASDPAGTVSQFAYAPPGTIITTPDLANNPSFAYWTLDDVRQQDAWGRALSVVTFTMATADRTCVATILTGDGDGDGLPDAWEQAYFGTLANGADSDPDGDGLTLIQEYAGGTNPLFADTTLAGGVAYADSAMVTVNLAGFYRYTLGSDPAGTVDQSAIVFPGTVITTPDLANNPSFAYWTLDGARQQDAWGRALSVVTFTMGSADRTCVATLLTGDSDGDGLPDAWEQAYFGTLANDATADPDGDGMTLAQEYAAGTNPLFAETTLAGGVAYADSSMVTVNLAGFSRYTITSDPPGTVDQSAVVFPGTIITTPDMAQSTFGYWTVDGVVQRDAWGVAFRQCSFTVDATERAAVAHLFAGDSDGDGIDDAVEWYYYGTLSNIATADSDGDGQTFLAEVAAGTSPVMANTTLNGGVAWADSSMVVVNLQHFERLDKILVNGTLQDFFSPDPAVLTGIQIGAEAAPAVTDWDGDGDFDLFVAHAAGLRVFRNIGTSGNPDFQEIFDGLGGLAGYIAALDHPVIAGGDWSGDGISDMIIGGNTNTLRLVQSNGTFTSDGSGLDLVTGSAKSLPALGDFNGDHQPDLLVLLADGSVRFHPNSGSPTPFSNPGVDNFLGITVPNALAITAGDLDQDGLCDVLVADSDGRIWEFHQLSGGGFSLKSKVWGGSGAGFAAGMTLAACDLENDGDTDLIAGLSNGGLLALRNPGAGRPAEITAQAGVDSVKLAWDANKQSRIRGYQVFRSTAAGPFEQLTADPLPLPGFFDESVTAGTGYHYYVRGLSYFYQPGNSQPTFVQSLPSDTVAPTVGTVKLTLQSANGKPGSYVQIPLSINNSLNLRGQDLAISVTYDPQILIPAKQANPDKDSVLLTGLSAGLGISDNGATASGGLTITGASGVIYPGSGKLFALQFRVKDTATPGQSSPLTITAATLKAVAGYQAVVDFAGAATFTVDTTYQAGDLTGDGAVTAADDTLLQILIKPKARTPTANELRAGDLNGNGHLDYQDLILLKRLIAGLPLNIGN
jgi:hypothetical protein